MDSEQHKPNDSLRIETPIGRLLFSICASEGNLHNTWMSAVDLEPKIPKGMSAEGCKAVLLRCTSSTPLRDVVFACSWEVLTAVGHACSGEGLDAWEWESNKMLVLVGTEDAEFLGSRLQLSEASSRDYPITMENNVLEIHICEFPANQELSLHYVVAWNSLPEPVDASCWFAVDVPHERVLKECG